MELVIQATWKSQSPKPEAERQSLWGVLSFGTPEYFQLAWLPKKLVPLDKEVKNGMKNRS